MTADPIRHLETDDLMCAGFVAEIEDRIAREYEQLDEDARCRTWLRYCKVCESCYQWVAVLSPFYEQAHRYRYHPDYVCTFEGLGSGP